MLGCDELKDNYADYTPLAHALVSAKPQHSDHNKDVCLFLVYYRARVALEIMAEGQGLTIACSSLFSDIQ